MKSSTCQRMSALCQVGRGTALAYECFHMYLLFFNCKTMCDLIHSVRERMAMLLDQQGQKNANRLHPQWCPLRHRKVCMFRCSIFFAVLQMNRFWGFFRISNIALNSNIYKYYIFCKCFVVHKVQYL